MNKQVELPDAMVDGFQVKQKASSDPVSFHPLQYSEKTAAQRNDQLNFTMLSQVQGLHAPLRLQMERKSVSKVGHLPFLTRHNAALEVLTGQDELIGFGDYLGNPKDPEVVGQPHAMVERHLGIL